MNGEIDQELYEALVRLCREVDACFGLSNGLPAREAFGNTNFGVVMERVNRAKEVLAKARGERP